jgi:hypothetical protein
LTDCPTELPRACTSGGQRLKRETEPTKFPTVESSPAIKTGQVRLSHLLVAALAVLLIASVQFLWRSKISLVAPEHDAGKGQTTVSIAVLPLQNLNGDLNVDYLRFALADELTSVLSYSRTLEVRPASTARKYVALDLDPKKVGTRCAWNDCSRARFESKPINC